MNLENVKAGDNIVVSNTFHEFLMKVERVTNTLVIVGPYRFNKKSGHISGDIYSDKTARIATDLDVKRIREANRRRSLIAQCYNTHFDNLSNEQLEKIVGIIDCSCRKEGEEDARY